MNYFILLTAVFNISFAVKFNEVYELIDMCLYVYIYIIIKLIKFDSVSEMLSVE